MIRRGSALILESTLGLAGIGLLALTTVTIVQTRQGLRRSEQRAVALEEAQNLLDAARAGQDITAAPGWTVVRRTLADGVELITVSRPGIHLSTLRRTPP
jgi:hypothetical protein